MRYKIQKKAEGRYVLVDQGLGIEMTKYFSTWDGAERHRKMLASCVSKRGYANIGTAQSAGGQCHPKQRAYHCEFCDKFHLTHLAEPPKAWKKRDRRPYMKEETS